MVNRIRLFRHKGKFYSITSDKKFKAKLNPVMIRAREEYLAQWRTNSYKTGGKRPTQSFHDDYMRMKSWMGDQTFYVQSSGCYYNSNGNTAELAIAYPIYQIDEQTRDIIKIDTCNTGRLSSAMLDILEPVDAFPRQMGGTVTPGEKYDIMRSSVSLNLDTYRDYKAVAGWNSDIFIALHGPEHRVYNGSMRYQMYGTGFHYANAYDDGYNYLDGKIYSHEEFLKEMDERIRKETKVTETPTPEDREIPLVPAEVPEFISEQDTPTITVTQHISSDEPVEPTMVEVHNAVSRGVAAPVNIPVAGPNAYGPRDYAGEAYGPGEPYGEPMDMQAAINLAREIQRATNTIGYTIDNNGDLTIQ